MRNPSLSRHALLVPSTSGLGLDAACTCCHRERGATRARTSVKAPWRARTCLCAARSILFQQKGSRLACSACPWAVNPSLTIHMAPPRDTNAPISTSFWTLELGPLAVHDGASGRSDRVVEDGGVSALASWCGLWSWSHTRSFQFRSSVQRVGSFGPPYPERLRPKGLRLVRSGRQ